MSATYGDDGGPAFPCEDFEHGFHEDTVTKHHGMTLRDWFAGQALEGMNASPALLEAVTAKVAGEGSHYERLARHAYLQADAMLEERSK